MSYATSAVINQPSSGQNCYAKRDWSVDFCHGCSSCKDCCYCTFCQWCILCKLCDVMDESCCSWYLGGLVPMRTKIRAERGIEGAIWKDVCSVLWCPQLTMYQMYNEAKNTRPLV